MKKFLEGLRQRFPRYYEPLSYLFFGVLTTLVNWLVYLALTSLLGLDGQDKASTAYKLIASLSQAVAWLLSVLFAYLTNRAYVFDASQQAGSQWKQLGLFFSSRLLGGLIFDLLLFNVFLLFMGDKPAKLIMNVLVVIYNYLASRYVIFKKDQEQKTADRRMDE